jgi:DNA repair ATPase RecN
MKLTNNEIYNYATKLASEFKDTKQVLPVKINFYLQKNKKLLLELAQDIEQARMQIAQTYGKYNGETQNYSIDPERIAEANKELNDLFTLEQDVNICMINFANIDDNLSLTTGQMEAMMFMIEGY